MSGDRIRGVVVVGVVVASLSACLALGPPRGTVVLYGRAAPADLSWFGLVPPGDPPEAVGFGSDGVACLDGPPGAEVAWYDATPGDDGRPKRTIGRIRGDGEPLVLWVEVRPDGSLLVGQGVPAWWSGDPQTC